MKWALLLCAVVAVGCSGDDTATTDAGPDAPGGDGSMADAGGDADAAPPPQCGTGAWLTYGHDAARTFASDACITGPLTVAWSYTPTPITGHTVNAVHHALAASDAVYLQWAGSDDPYIGTTAADRVSTAGARVWTFDSGSDANMGNWASVSGSTLVIEDDGAYFVDLAAGTAGVKTGVDWWGQTIPDGAGGVWFSNTAKSDGPGLFVGELDATAKATWKGNVQGTSCGDGLGEVMGGIAIDGGVLFYAPSYTEGGSVQPTYPSGVYAFDAASGAAKWNVATTPSSTISAGHGFVYLVESGKVVARSQADGGVAWSQPLAGAGAQAPVLANDLVIAAGSAGVSAFDATTGAPAWSTPLTGAAAHAYTMNITNGCSGSQYLGAAIATSLAAAVPSDTLVVTASDGVHVLSLTTGTDEWNGAVPGAKHAVHDPVIVGKTLYVVDSAVASTSGFGAGQLIALTGI
jgi:hypothetical protein